MQLRRELEHIKVLPSKVQWNRKLKQRFYQNLAILLSSGLDALGSLQLMTEDESEVFFRKRIPRIMQGLTAGLSLSEALRNESGFQTFDLNSVSVGEETGTLQQVLLQLSSYYDRELNQRRQLMSALAYPVFIFIVAIGIVLFMLLYVVPMFEEIFQRLGGELPGITKLIVRASHAAPFLISMAGFLLILILGGSYYIKATPSLQLGLHRFLLRLYWIRRLIRTSNEAKIVNALSLLLKAKIPLTRSIELAGTMISNRVYRAGLNEIQRSLLRGESFSRALRSSSLFSSRLVSIIKVGEETNHLAEMFQSLNDQLKLESDENTKRFNKMLEPALMLIIGAIVAFILIAMYLPMFQMSNSLSF